jgi:hypothetical protein
MGAPLATVALFNAVLFSARGRMEAALAHADGSPLTIGDQAIAGAGAGVAVAAIATPTELIKVRLQAQLSAAQAAGIAGQAPAAAVRGASAPATLFAAAGAGAASSRPSLALPPALPPAPARGPLDGVRPVMAAEGGLLGLSRGLTCTLAREVPGNAVMFAVYESLKRAIASHQGLASTADLGTGALIVAGGAAGTAFWIPVFPADVVKSRWQADTPAACMGLNEVALGIPVPEFWQALLGRVIGRGPAERLCLFARLVAPAEGMRLGLVDAVVPVADLDAAASKVAAAALAMPDGARVETKRRERAAFAADWVAFAPKEAVGAWAMLASPATVAARSTTTVAPRLPLPPPSTTRHPHPHATATAP